MHASLISFTLLSLITFLILILLKGSIISLLVVGNSQNNNTGFYWAFTVCVVTCVPINLTQNLLFSFKRGWLVAFILLVCEYAVLFPLVYFRTFNEANARTHSDKYLENIWVINSVCKIVQLVAEIVALKTINRRNL